MNSLLIIIDWLIDWLFIHPSPCIVCDLRNTRQRSSDNNSQPADGVYETPTQPGQDDDQPQYDVIELGQTQRGHGGPDAGDHYDSLNPHSRGEQSQYELISPRRQDRDGPDYVDVM